MANDQSHTYLSIYLQDHMAGAMAGIELAERLRSNQGETEPGRKTGQILEEIVDDRRILEAIMERLDVESSNLKNTAAWFGEKLGRFKPNGHALTRSPLSEVFELEALTTGVVGKRSLWESLEASPYRDQLAEFDLPGLIERADDQAGRLREMHRRAAQRAFSPRPSDQPAASSEPRPERR